MESGILTGVARTFAPQIVYFNASGVLFVTTGVGRFLVPAPMQLLDASMTVNTAPTTTSIIVDINKNGTTIFTNQNNRLTIAATANTTLQPIIPDITLLNINDYLTVDIDQIGSGTAGSDLTVVIRYRLFP